MTSELHSIFRICDVAGEDVAVRRLIKIDIPLEQRLKHVGVFEKKRALFRKEHGEPFIHGHLRLVRFHLAEIGIHSRIENESIVKDKFTIDTTCALKRSRLETRQSRVDCIQSAKTMRKRVGIDLLQMPIMNSV